MPELIYDIKSFRGVDLDKGATSFNTIQCDNFDATIDENATSIYHGFLTKFPKSEAVGDDIGSQVSRGVFLFKRYDGNVYLQAFSDGTVRYLTGGNWTSLITGENGGYQFSFDSFNYLDKTFFSDGNQTMFKYHPSWTSAYGISDKEGGTTTTITGNLTFTTDDATVTAAGGAFTTELSAGDWIRKDSTEDWYEVLSITTDDELELMVDYLGTTGAGGADTSELCNKTSLRGRFIKVWKDRLVIGALALYWNLLKEDGDFLLTELGGKILMED